MNSVMSPPATKPPRRRGPRGSRKHGNNTSGDQDVTNRQPTANHSSGTPRYTPSTAAPPSAPQRQLYIPPPRTPSIPKVQILKPSTAPPAPPPPPIAPAARTTLMIRERQPPPAPIQTRPPPETATIAVVDDDHGNDKSSLPASPPPLASPKPAPAPPPPPPFETPDHKSLIRDRQAQIAAYLSRWDALFALASAKDAHDAEPNSGKRLPWPIENNSVDGAGWRPWGEYLHTGHGGT
ncbi:unnamed protein product [Tuber melanosporum]|uniref:(Perigord truffle) hypothetical protein n=1 Tax=Tuber melanosporum (strain Mel28) TaxID=656061 RepID=D5G804_TUBMM|nr:uncharacterized protein GSTUM_00002769001 [Tuber melanosporum]CAZ80647.1 unnamed protein product [Tuber melanosporum]